ncbi:MAG: hypothetical protein A2086_12875 [Spirochaetes bacterium GWD1_27_9]|nr:MAG: hypothetical protein A2Z98_00680 [Spirochaetes bacterium GWB1_27_13]OHD24760.1 MAG: hypothetical protein A2Y34_08425 [Spirochaetes bacterium GWC1_27_15]OHD43967.1 MAG: hypothetical protein A2086_12875 [Spirochaetes bacterium GWD1_27_9]
MNMKKEVVIFLAEDDDGHSLLIKKNLKRAGVLNEIFYFRDGEEILNYIKNNREKLVNSNFSYLFLIDIRMPKVDGVEVLRQLKKDKDFHKMPVIMITTTDDPKEIALCHEIGCNNYITKPVDYDKFANAIQQLGLFLLITEIPEMII